MSTDDTSPTDGPEGEHHVASRLIDLSEVDLRDLAAIERPALAEALQSIRDEIAHPEEAVAGFNSSL